MDTSSIELPGSEVKKIEINDDIVIIRFSPAYIIKTMTGSNERTRWKQSGELVFTGVEIESMPPPCPCVCSGGDVGENVYTYRDMIPIPLKSQGLSHCKLRFEGTDLKLVLKGSSVSLNMEDRPHYIEHIKPG